MALQCALLPLLLFVAQQDYIADGLKALDASQPAAAESLFRQAVAADAKDFSAHFDLALALSVEHKDNEAIDELRRTLDLKPGLFEAGINLGTLLLRNNRAAEAVPVLRAASENPGNSPQQNGRAGLLYAQALEATQDYAHAAERYNAVLETDPKSAAAEAGLARIALVQSSLPEAAGHFRKAAALDPDFKSGLLDVASAYEHAGKNAEAIAIYREFPENTAARDRIAQLLVQGDSLSAIPVLEAAVKQAPTTANRLAFADALKQNKQIDKAIEQLQLAVAAEPANFDLRMDLGKELRDQRRFVPAAEQFAAAAKIQPDSVKAWNELAAVFVVNEDYANGLAALDHVRALGKENAGDFFYRAISLEKLKQPKPALEAYKQFLAADGGKLPDQEFQARQRIRIIESELNRK